MKKLFAEFFGTYWLVFGGCGSALFAAGIPELGIGFAGVSLAFGLTVLTMAFAVGHISGGHFNPAVTLGLWAGGRFPAKEVIGYIIAQVVGGIIAASRSASCPMMLRSAASPGSVGSAGRRWRQWIPRTAASMPAGPLRSVNGIPENENAAGCPAARTRHEPEKLT